ncbi:outer membrane beta-barrel protein [Dyadobacter diqingensis]|uniref:outer membrane beta-barrel protein n=1 Tax=Dyadobacter diqingensis TaxID=2938121 RepID=UPI0020C1A2E3|nr:outer membrane beta-barrel protein [Dyadobacter diqingensis]
MKAIFLSLCLLCTTALRAQTDSIDARSSVLVKGTKNYLGFKVGGVASTFTHNRSLAIPSLNGGALLAWQAGISADLFTRKHYNARAELVYLSKGAKETFSNDRIDIHSKNKLNYIQLSVLPLIVKAGFEKVNPYLGIGGYYARRVGIRSSWKYGDEWQNDALSADVLNARNDFGYSVALGIYVWKKPFAEIRYEGGLKSVSASRNVKNSSIILSFSI